MLLKTSPRSGEKVSTQNDYVITLLDQRLRDDKRQLERKLNEFRTLCQRPELRREFDLNDPDHLKKSVPARVSDDDHRCSVSGMQKFEGEDANKNERAFLQKQQQHKWLLQQVRLQKEEEDVQNEADAIYNQNVLALDRRAYELQEAEDACRKALDISTSNYNAALVKQREQESVFDKQRELEDNFAEMSNAIFGDFLNDQPDASRLSQGGPKKSSTNWRGFTPEQVAEIRRIQKQQVEEKKELLERAQLETEQWDQYMASTTRVALLKEFEQLREKHGDEQKMMADNLALANQQQAFNAYLNKEVYVNRASEAFFDQFNRTAR